MTKSTRMWWNTQTLPHHGRNEWAVWDGKPRVCIGLDEVQTRLARWHPANPVFVGVPNSESFTPPTCVPETEKQVVAAYRRQAFFGIAAFSLVTGASLLAGLYKPKPLIIVIAVIFAAIAATLAADYFGNLRNVRNLTERARFFYWLKVNKTVRVGYLVWLGISTLMGAAQWLLELHNSQEDILIQYGLVYDSALSGEWWRFIVGPFFHSGLAHYLNNAISLLFIGPLLWAMFGARCLVVFLSGNIVAAAAQKLVGTVDYEAFLGVSGGLYAMVGSLISAAWINRGLLPSGMLLLCVSIAAISAVGASLLSSSTADVAHFSGVLLGISSSLILRREIHSIGREVPPEDVA